MKLSLFLLCLFGIILLAQAVPVEYEGEVEDPKIPDDDIAEVQPDDDDTDYEADIGDDDLEGLQFLDEKYDDIDKVDMRNLTAGQLYMTSDNQIFEYNGVDLDSLGKRQMGCGQNGIHTQYKVFSKSTYWTKLKQSSGCQFCKNNPAGGSVSISYSFTKGNVKTGNAGIDFSKVVGLSASVGYSITDSKTVGSTSSCNCAAKNKKTCIFTQVKMAKLHVGVRKCPSNTCNGEVLWKQCGKWKKQYNYAPLKRTRWTNNSCEVKRCKCK